MEFDLYFKNANKLNIKPFILSKGVGKETSVVVLNDIVEEQQIGISQSISAVGLKNGKKGSFKTDAIDSKTPKLLADSVNIACEYGKEYKEEYFYKGGDINVEKADVLDPNFKSSTLKEIRQAALDLSSEIKKLDSRIKDCNISITLGEIDSKLIDGMKLDCSEKLKCYTGSISLICNDLDGEPRSSYDVFNSFLSLDDLILKMKSKAKNVLKKAVDLFKSQPCNSGIYNVVLNQECVSTLVSFLLSHLNSKMIEKHLSIYENKLNTQIISPLITINHTPHKRAMSSRSYDSCGYPSKDFNVVNKGILKNIFYSYENAIKENVTPNGCSQGNGNGGPFTLTIENGSSTLKEAFNQIQNGLYITSLSGISTGLDDQTLDFSLPCEGYLVKDGVIDKAVSMIVVSGNLKDLFNHCILVCNDSEYQDGVFTPSMAFTNIAISGK